MPNIDDASVKLLYASDLGTTFTIDDIKLDDSFDVVMDIEIGSNLNQVAGSFDARVGVRNLTQSLNVSVVTKSGNLVAPVPDAPRNEEVRINVPAGWSAGTTKAAVGDVLQLVGSYTVNAGARRDVSMVESPTFIVSA